MSPLKELAALFFKLGTLAFGGPAAHIAMMRQEVVERHAWLSDAEFLDLLGAVNLIPGPSSTELAIYIGFRQAGWRGLLLAGACFILPAAFLTLALAWLYVRLHALPQVAGIFYGVQPVVVAIVLHALFEFSRARLRNPICAVTSVAGFVLAALGWHQLLILLICGFAVVLTRWPRQSSLLLFGIASTSAAAAAMEPITLGRIFLVFAKIGSIVFGSGYVLLALLQSELVQNLHWLTDQQLLDAVAAGQITPGPVFTTATFIGYLLAGFPGAVVATVAIFLPGFLLVAASSRLIPRMRRSAAMAAFLDGVTSASIALIGWTLVLLSRAAVTDALTLGVALGSAFLLFRKRVNAAWLVAGGAVIGFTTRMI